MKKISLYFFGSCISFTIAIVVAIIIHLMDKQNTINVNSEIFLLFIIILINVTLYFLEDLRIKSQIIHTILELCITVIITFLVGMPIKFINIESIYDVFMCVFIIALIYGITILSIYIFTQNDAKDINKKLSAK